MDRERVCYYPGVVMTDIEYKEMSESFMCSTAVQLHPKAGVKDTLLLIGYNCNDTHNYHFVPVSCVHDTSLQILYRTVVHDTCMNVWCTGLPTCVASNINDMRNTLHESNVQLNSNMSAWSR